MGLLNPTPTPYDPLSWVRRPFTERGRMVCEAWAMQGYGAPPSAYALHVLKLALYVGGWVAFCATSPVLGLGSTVASWWLHPIAFQKAVVYSLLFEVLGLGCGSGPMTGRYLPPLGGFLYFLRPGTTKLPLFPGLPMIGGRTRTALDVLLYAALLAACTRALLAPAPGSSDFLPVAVLVPILGILDKTTFLAARAEHYWATVVCFAFGAPWIASAKVVQLALWFWAGVSKLNHHFPSVVAVMTSNGPLTRSAWLRRRMYQRYPDDLRPSRLAVVMAHIGTALELGVPIAFLLTPLGAPPVVAVALMLALHLYITSHVPMGVPIEWNAMVAYGGFALLWAHPDVSIAAAGPPALTVFLVLAVGILPLAGNLFPARVSFLLAMRYYAGNWPYSVWLFRGETYRKLSRMTMTSPWIYDQLAPFYDRATAIGLVGKVMGFRLMHLHGRALPRLVPRAVERFEDYEWVDGEMVAGMVLGWNFGDGHLHQEQLLAAVQAQCGFDPGELRVICVEPERLGGGALAYRITDAATGRIDAGEIPVAELLGRKPWVDAAA